MTIDWTSVAAWSLGIVYGVFCIVLAVVLGKLAVSDMRNARARDRHWPLSHLHIGINPRTWTPSERGTLLMIGGLTAFFAVLVGPAVVTNNIHTTTPLHEALRWLIETFVILLGAAMFLVVILCQVGALLFVLFFVPFYALRAVNRRRAQRPADDGPQAPDAS